MFKNELFIKQILFAIALSAALCAQSVLAQTTAFTYQGKLTDSGMPQGTYQMSFALYDDLAGGNQVGVTITNPSVAVTQGVFTVPLDFGPVFDGADRYLEIAVKRNPGEPFTVLTPRQPVTSTPHSVQSLNSSLFGSLPPSRFVQFDEIGSVGIGIAPAATVKLDVNGNTLIRTAGSGGNIQLGNPGGETGISILGAGRADVRFNGTTLKLVAGPVGGPPPSTNGIIVNTSGQVLIGTENLGLGAKFSVFNSDTLPVMHVASNNVFGVPLVAQNTGGGVAGRFLGKVELNLLGSAGATPLCLNFQDFISPCSSSLRYKKDLQPYGDGLGFINQLHPIAYKWKADNMPDIGFGAEDVEKINPLFVTYNDKGEVEGVKYDRLSVVFVNAFKEQQTQIEQQKQQLGQQQTQIENLKKLICSDRPNADICQEK